MEKISKVSAEGLAKAGEKVGWTASGLIALFEAGNLALEVITKIDLTTLQADVVLGIITLTTTILGGGSSLFIGFKEGDKLMSKRLTKEI